MKVSVVGLWHLGSVTAACLADFGHQVTAVDKNKNLINDFKSGVLPIYEPGLDKLTKKYFDNGGISYSSKFSDIKNSDVVWVTYDTPVDDDDNADVEFVENQIKDLINYINPSGTLIISSQMPIESTSKLKNYITKNHPNYNIKLAYSPENLRLGNAINVFTNPDRVIVGVFEEDTKNIIEELLNKIKNKIIWMSVPSAEMTKHAINSFLALSVTFINELSSFCELTGADASEVEIGLKSENRIGPKSYLKPGPAFAGGTLARDLKFLVSKANELNINSTLFEAALKSNDQHKNWIKNKLITLYKNLDDIKITVLGLTYKPNTSTLRRSLSVELCNWLISKNIEISVFDPKIKLPPKELKGKFNFFENLNNDLFKTDVIVLFNECEEFLEIDFDLIYKTNSDISIIDPNGFLYKSKINSINKFNYYKIGKSQ